LEKIMGADSPEVPERSTHRYEEIASELRDAINRGDYQEGDRLPGENAIMRDYGVARMTARDALAQLQHEGLAVARRGAGVFVSSQVRIVRDSMGRYSRARALSTSPFKSDAKSAGQRGHWEANSVEAEATAGIAARLNIEPGEAVMVTDYRFMLDSQPVQLSRSWEPLSLTRGTPIELPEESPVTGVIARMDLIGQRADRVVERVTARASVPEEIERLGLPKRGSYVLVIDRTHYAGERPIETCDIIFPGDRYELTYTIPVLD
jgi:DNA-binding GntR family transcriptional regulator